MKAKAKVAVSEASVPMSTYTENIECSTFSNVFFKNVFSLLCCPVFWPHIVGMACPVLVFKKREIKTLLFLKCTVPLTDTVKLSIQAPPSFSVVSPVP